MAQIGYSIKPPNSINENCGKQDKNKEKELAFRILNQMLPYIGSSVWMKKYE